MEYEVKTTGKVNSMRGSRDVEKTEMQKGPLQGNAHQDVQYPPSVHGKTFRLLSLLVVLSIYRSEAVMAGELLSPPDYVAL